MASLRNQFKQSPKIIKVAITTVAMVWLIAIVSIFTFACTFIERPVEAEPPAPGAGNPTIALVPTVGPVDTPVTVYGQGWQAGSTILFYLETPEQVGRSGYAFHSAVADESGRFNTLLVIPADSRWSPPALVRVVARADEGTASAEAFFSLIALPEQATETPTLPLPPTATPTATPTTVVQPPTPTPQPVTPLVTANTDLNVRGGPGTGYAILGLLRSGQSAEVTGISPDGGWWQIKFSGVPDGRGWLSARYVTAQYTGNVPVVQPMPLPPTATPRPTPTPAVINDWRGEYYNNPTLSGNPVLVRNDMVVNFDWGTGAPVSGVGADNFSVRWTRNLYFSAGTHRFSVYVDDGVRLWVDNILLIDQWHDSTPTTYVADINLTEGSHSLRLEYYEHAGTALVQLSWERGEAYYPDWKGEYYSNPNLSGSPVLVRNDPSISFGWGPNSPGSSIPADNFSARWTRNQHFSAGTYRFKVVVDDGARLWVDGNLVIDQWRTGEPKTYTNDVTLTQGTHSLRLEYFDYRYDAQVRLEWTRVDSYPDWKAEYFDNRKLEGDPILVRNETEIDHNWGSGSPGGVPADNFSARWTRKVDFQDATYRFQATVDDGVRLWLDNDLVIDDWRDARPRTIEVERRVSDGQHRVKVEYYEHSGDAEIEIDWSKKSEPANQPPQAVPGGPYIVNEGNLVNLDGRNSRDPDGSIVRYEWDFEYNGSSFDAQATEATAITRYADGPATVIVALRVTDNKGATNLATTQVTVQNVPPAVEAGGPYAGQTNTPITLAGTATDPGLVDQAGLTYHWDFGDGSTGNGQIVSHSYGQAGTYTAKLTVTDKDGGWGSDTATVQVTQPNQPPRAVINGPTSGKVGEVLSFNANGSTDSDGTIASYVWNFGDGGTGNGLNITHTYNAAGNYDITLTVTDNGGLSHSATHRVVIEKPVIKRPPAAVINGPTSGLVGEPLNFSGTGSADEDGQIVAYAWDFGDGTTSNRAETTHSYEVAGTYKITLTVTDNDDLTDTASSTVWIKKPVQIKLPPTAVIAGPTTAQISQTVTFDGSGSNDSDGNIVSYDWDFGDGDTGSGVTVSHAYTQIGKYIVRLTVTDNDGLTASIAQPLVVKVQTDGVLTQ
jgi:PKD repeat protein